jgi:hypothetical protein
MKSLPFLATFAVLAACAESPTAPSTQSYIQPNLSVAQTGTIRAARNPSTTGQPGASCQHEKTSPNGFNSGGFALLAVTVYAGSPGTPSLANGNSHAVSQYDVACYQLSNK